MILDERDIDLGIEHRTRQLWAESICRCCPPSKSNRGASGVVAVGKEAKRFISVVSTRSALLPNSLRNHLHLRRDCGHDPLRRLKIPICDYLCSTLPRLAN